jgi:hypothetical protein
LVGVVQDVTANPKARRKAALKIAEYLLPKVPKKPKVLPDEYGFWIGPKLASAYRDIQLELRDLKSEPTRKIPAIAARIEKLEARSKQIHRRLQVPCPTTYGDKEATNDFVRLAQFDSLRANETALTESQQAEEAHVRARYDVFCEGPEAIARRRRQELQDANRRFRMHRFTGEFYAPPLTRKERSTLKLLRWLYPAPPKPILSELDDFWIEMLRDHPFVHELSAPNGNFYPRDSKLYPRHCKTSASRSSGLCAR